MGLVRLSMNDILKLLVTSFTEYLRNDLFFYLQKKQCNSMLQMKEMNPTIGAHTA